MNFRFWRRDDAFDELPKPNYEAARLAEVRAKVFRAKVSAERSEVYRIAERLRELREQNHFAEKINATLSERHE